MSFPGGKQVQRWAKMDQKPMGGAEPLPMPTTDVARAYLDVITTVEQRREERIDRRMLGWLHMIDGFVVGALFSAALIVVRAEPLTQYLWLLIVLALIIWTEFAGELRDRVGVRPQWFRSWSMPYLLVFLPAMMIAWLSSQTPHPSALLPLAPFGISVLVFGTLAVRQWRRASGQDNAGVLAAPEPFTWRAAVATVVVGVTLGALVFVGSGVTEPTTGTVIVGILLGVLLVFTIASQTGSWMPVLGRIWLWPQWTAPILAGVLFLASLVLGASMRVVTLPGAVLMGAFVVVLFVVVAVWGIRRAEVTGLQRKSELGRSS